MEQVKRIEDLTHEELVVLTEEQLERFVAIEIATAGIMPVEPPKETTFEDEGIKEQIIAYNVDGILFEKEDDAMAVANMKRFKEAYDWNINSEYRWLEQATKTGYDKKSYYKQEDILRIKDILQKNKRKRDEYQNKQNKYSEYLRKTGDIRNRVYNTFGDARDKQAEINKAQETYDKYKELANGNEEVAKGFFRNTYKGLPEMLKAILGEEPVKTEEPK